MDLRDMEYQIGKLAPHLIESKKIAFGTKKVPIHIIKAWEKTGAVIIVDDVAPFDYFMGLKSEHRFGLELEEL